jgi:transcription elongation GreA/GreB family factor
MQDGEHATVGSRVTLVQADSNRRLVYTLLGPWDADQSKNVISYLAPLGTAMLGKKVGDTVSLEVAAGTLTYRVEGIEDGLEAVRESRA